MKRSRSSKPTVKKSRAPCVEFFDTNRCPRGFDCGFDHTVIDPDQDPVRYAERAKAVQRIKEMPCKKFQTGECTNPLCLQVHRIMSKEEVAKIAEERKEKKVNKKLRKKEAQKERRAEALTEKKKKKVEAFKLKKEAEKEAKRLKREAEIAEANSKAVAVKKLRGEDSWKKRVVFFTLFFK
jgi:hypothetical protein